MGFVPRSPSFTNLSFVDPPDPLTGHSFLLCTLHLIVGIRGLTLVQNVLLPLTNPSNNLLSRVCNLLRLYPIHPPAPAYGA